MKPGIHHAEGSGQATRNIRRMRSHSTGSMAKLQNASQKGWNEGAGCSSWPLLLKHKRRFRKLWKVTRAVACRTWVAKVTRAVACRTWVAKVTRAVEYRTWVAKVTRAVECRTWVARVTRAVACRTWVAKVTRAVACRTWVANPSDECPHNSTWTVGDKSREMWRHTSSSAAYEEKLAEGTNRCSCHLNERANMTEDCSENRNLSDWNQEKRMEATVQALPACVGDNRSTGTLFSILRFDTVLSENTASNSSSSIAFLCFA
jgi:hypothetical protein